MGLPTAGDVFNVMESEQSQKVAKKNAITKRQSVRTQKHITLDEIGRRMH